MPRDPFDIAGRIKDFLDGHRGRSRLDHPPGSVHVEHLADDVFEVGAAHASSHEDGGADEIDCTGLAGIPDVAAYVAKALFDAYTILMATANDTPVALTVAEQTLVGRITSGAIAALTIAQVKTLLGAGAASGLATLSAGTKVVEDPANATATPTASKIPIADGSGKLDGWLTDPLTKSVRLTAAPASDHTANGIIIALTAGENVVFGDACYIKSDGKAWKADADAIATGGAVALAIATIAADASGDFLLQGIARDDTWTWTVGGLIFLSTTPGPPTQTAPSATDDVIQVLGVATHADRMLWMPQLTQVEHT